MKKLIAGIIIFVLVCIASTGAAPAGTGPAGSTYLQQNQPGQGIAADVHDVVLTQDTIHEQRQDIRQDVRDTNQDIRENFTAGHEAIQDQRQAMYENHTIGNGTIRQERQGMFAYFNQSRIQLADNVTDLQSQILAERQADQAQIANFTDVQKRHLMNWYNVQIASHALMAMQNLTGDIGPQVAEIANDINSTESNITPLEQQIENRNGFFRFLFGGDRSAANQINDQVALNQQRIQTLEQLAQNSTLQPDVQQAMQDQISILEQEQARLANLTATETNSTGLLWWI